MRRKQASAHRHFIAFASRGEGRTSAFWIRWLFCPGCGGKQSGLEFDAWEELGVAGDRAWQEVAGELSREGTASDSLGF